MPRKVFNRNVLKPQVASSLAVPAVDEFPRTTQAMVFTHHAHVVECGWTGVAQDLQVLEL